MCHSPGLTSAGVVAAGTLSPLAWVNDVLSDPDVWWETYTQTER